MNIQIGSHSIKRVRLNTLEHNLHHNRFTWISTTMKTIHTSMEYFARNGLFNDHSGKSNTYTMVWKSLHEHNQSETKWPPFCWRQFPMQFHWFVPMGSINNIPALVQTMAWHQPGDKLLSEPMIVSFLTHIDVTRPQQHIKALCEMSLVIHDQSFIIPYPVWFSFVCVIPAIHV